MFMYFHYSSAAVNPNLLSDAMVIASKNGSVKLKRDAYRRAPIIIYYIYIANSNENEQFSRLFTKC